MQFITLLPQRSKRLIKASYIFIRFRTLYCFLFAIIMSAPFENQDRGEEAGDEDRPVPDAQEANSDTDSGKAKSYGIFPPTAPILVLGVIGWHNAV